MWLNLDESTFQALMNSVVITFCSLSLFVTFVVTSNRRRRVDSEVKVGFVNENWVDLESDDSTDEIEVTPIVSVITEEEITESVDDDLPQTPVSKVVLDDELEDLGSSSNRSARTSRRERRAVEAEMKQVMEEMHLSLIHI